ncbi:hypothetical protein [Myroides sp. N17-2]|uniref:hypothetical protein n=1 Tax=Myroides sp. N17-2 TaxID=2030799 RepID=UPI000EFC02A0|nr:hypothetical protein [Myroides sp. N17-2]
MKKQLLLYSWVILFFTSCSSRYVAVVSPEAKMEFGIMLEAPSKGMFFVENEKVGGPNVEHTNTANSLYNKYGPATDQMFVGRTNARQLKFKTEGQTYLVDITKFKKGTAMVIFDGKNKPIITFNVNKYRSLAKKYFGKEEGNRFF